MACLKAFYLSPSCPSWNSCEVAELILTASGADIRHGGSRAFYSPSQDFVQMPDRSAFATSDDYYRIALHELTHWSGHPSRCNRVLSSLDGMTLEGNLVLEIKCPLRGTRSDLWLDVSAGQVPEHYAVQVQHQLMVSGAKLAHLWVFDGTKGNGDHMTCAARARAPWRS